VSPTDLFRRIADLTMPTLADDDREPVAVRRTRVAASVALWDAHVRYEREQRRNDQAAAAEAAAAARPTADPDAAWRDAQRAERRAAQDLEDRRARVRLAAEQGGMRYVVTVDGDATGRHRELHRLTAPHGHPDTARPPWSTGSPIQVAGQVLVFDVQGDTLNDCEAYLGLPHDAAQGGPSLSSQSRQPGRQGQQITPNPAGGTES
jgi:hypothetical protein